jgi:sugar phosphate isomerase/epimerase
VTSPVTSSRSSAPVVADFTFSFNCIPEVPMETRFEAARDAGFVDVGLSVRWMNQWLQTHDLAELDEKLEQFGVRVAELEAIRVMGEEIDPLEDLAALLAEHLRPDRLQAVGPYSETEIQAALRAGRVADRFAQWNVDVVLEPLPFTNMKTPADAASIILLADRPNLSMCLDIWHLYRNNLPLSHLDDLWPYISTLQINDGTLLCEYPEDLREDCLRNRRIPGLGEFDLVGLFRERNAHRADSTFSIEVISTELKAQDPFLTARQIAEGLDSVLTAVRQD